MKEAVLDFMRWFGFNDRPYVTHEYFDVSSGHKTLPKLDFAVALCDTLESHDYPYIEGIIEFLDSTWDIVVDAMDDMDSIQFWGTDYNETYKELNRISELLLDTMQECRFNKPK